MPTKSDPSHNARRGGRKSCCQSNRLNSIMKKVTSWAAIIAVPTAITGFYGQNVPYPGFGQQAGFWASTLLTAVASVSLYVLFRRNDWL